ncbi:phosphomannomutase [candidate division Kazan bacterium]|uniref:Phosphomannomutase n=1 Tax=candidate division Kazan bacterium TaxID=2202143 RepID=A0A420ZAN5_UNCK3|nr:MAG: phosphomannomutase [candidate division Kazan bacterium]
MLVEDVRINGESFKPKPVLKLTVENHFDIRKLSETQKRILELLNKESKINKFEIILQ